MRSLDPAPVTSGVDNRRRSVMKTIGALAALPLNSLVAQGGQTGQIDDVVVLLPGITGSVLKKNGVDVWGITQRSIIDTLATFGRNIDGLVLKDDPIDADELGDGVVASSVFPDVHL